MIKLYKDIENVMSRIESQWQKHQFSADHFPDVVYEETAGLDLSDLGQISNQMKLLELPGVRYQQQRSTFSDLYFQIYHNGRFMIEILNWWGGHVNVHDHDFSAVQFQLKGDALNVVYDFAPEKTYGALRFGELDVRKASIWKEGGKSIVRPGALDPHSVFHIGAPTTSLLIRTAATSRYGAQSNYFPTLAAHYYVANDIQRKKLTALSLLARNSEDEFRRCLIGFLGTQSLSENFFMLLKLGATVFREEFVSIVGDYAGRGENESKIVESVAFNNGIDFIKTKANETPGLSYAEKLCAFSVSAAFNSKNFTKVERDIAASGVALDFKKELKSFVGKLDSRDQDLASRYFEIFELSELLA